MDEPTDPNRSVRDNLVVGIFFNAGWMLALVGLEVIFIQHSAYGYYPLAAGSISYVASHLWPTTPRRERALLAHDLRNAPHKPASLFATGAFIPLSKAAEQAYIALEGTPLGDEIEGTVHFREGFGGSTTKPTEEILRVVMLSMSKHGEVTGVKWPSGKREPVGNMYEFRVYPTENCLRYKDGDRQIYSDLATTQAVIDAFVSFWKHIGIQEAAQIAYERAEKEGWLDVVSSDTSDPQDRLTTFKYMMVIQATEGSITLYGIEPPSRQTKPIPRGKLKNLYPERGASVLRSLNPARNAYETVTISGGELEKVIATYRTHAEKHEPGSLSFKEGILRLLEAVEGSDYGDIILGLNKTQKEQIGYFASSLLLRGQDDRPVVPIYGKRNPSRISRLIPDSDIKHLEWDHSREQLRSLFASEPAIYSDVTLNASGFDEHLKWYLVHAEKLGKASL